MVGLDCCAVICRDIYHGVAVWNRTRKRNDWGKWDPQPRPESEWQYQEVEHLRIIDEALWKRVQGRREATEQQLLRFDRGRLSGKAPGNPPSSAGRPRKDAVHNLLAGFATCGVCGGGLVVETGGKKRGRHPEYICHRRRANGACSNTLKVLASEMHEAVLHTIEEHVFTLEAIEQVIQLTERDDAAEQQAALVRERKDLDKRIERLVIAVERAGDVASLADKLRELEARRKQIDHDLVSLRPLPRLPQQVIENQLGHWRRLLRGSPLQGRAVLQRILRSRIVFTPRADGDGYDFTAPTRFDKLFTGIVVPRPSFIPYSKEGAEHIRPEDTLDVDYGRLMESTLNGWRARRDLNPRPTGSKPAALSN